MLLLECVVLQVVDAVEVLQGNLVVHFDIKCDNILLEHTPTGVEVSKALALAAVAEWCWAGGNC